MKACSWADYWFDDPENVEKIKKYYHDLRSGRSRPNTTRDALSFQKERAWEARRSVEADRRSLDPAARRPGESSARGGRQARDARPGQGGGRDP